LTVFDVVFYLLCLVSVLMLLMIYRRIRAGRRLNPSGIMRIIGSLIAVYFAVLLTVKLATPIDVYQVGGFQVAGDWFLFVDSWYPEPSGDQRKIVVNFRIENRADRGDLSQEGLIAYIVDGDGSRYDALPAGSEPPFDAVVKPGKMVRTQRSFMLRGDPQRLELVVAHHGIRRTWFVIGRTPFDGSSVVRLQ
jgi:hypothetical protein